MSGWNLTGRLISKHFSALGDKVSEAIASFDPETATEADRDRLAETLRQTATKLASARASFNKERDDVVNLQRLIENDEKLSETLIEKLANGSIAESTVNLFCDELEANKARLPIEQQEEADAREYMEELQKILDALSKQLADFDAQAKKAIRALATAEAQKDLQEMRIQRQEQLQSLSSMKSHSSALSALSRKAEKVSNEAEGIRIVAEIGQKPLDQQAELQALRDSAGKANASETAIQRLQRLSGKSSVSA